MLLLNYIIVLLDICVFYLSDLLRNTCATSCLSLECCLGLNYYHARILIITYANIMLLLNLAYNILVCMHEFLYILIFYHS